VVDGGEILDISVPSAGIRRGPGSVALVHRSFELGIGKAAVRQKSPGPLASPWWDKPANPALASFPYGEPIVPRGSRGLSGRRLVLRQQGLRRDAGAKARAKPPGLKCPSISFGFAR